MNAEQYRALVAKLEAINEAPDDEPPASGTTTASAPAATDPNQIPTIEAPTFSQAYAKARKMGLKKFKWCGVYAVKDKVNTQPAVTKPEPGKVDWIGQSDPLGGDMKNPMSFAPNSNFGA